MSESWDDLPRLAREIEKTESRGEALLLVALWGERDGWQPQAQYPVANYRIDVAIPEAKIAVESDGHKWHSTNAAMESDHDRQNELVRLGWTPLRYSASRSFLTTGRCAVEALQEIKRRLKAPGDRRRPNPPTRYEDLSRVSLEESRAAAKAFMTSLAAVPPPGESPLVPRGRR